MLKLLVKQPLQPPPPQPLRKLMAQQRTLAGPAPRKRERKVLKRTGMMQLVQDLAMGMMVVVEEISLWRSRLWNLLLIAWVLAQRVSVPSFQS